MRRYELMLLLRPDMEDDKLQSAVEKVTRAIVNAGGSLSKVSPWGKRRLAYPIQHHREASYFLIHFDIEPAQVRGIERGLLISEEILRHLVTVLEDRGAASAEEELVPAASAEEGLVPAAAPEEAALQATGEDVRLDKDEGEDLDEGDDEEDDLATFGHDTADEDQDDEDTDGTDVGPSIRESARA